jgi:hypothetical protein
MHLLAEAREQLAQDQLGTGIDVDQPFGHAELVAEQAAQRRRIRFGVVVAARHLGLRGGDGGIDRR